MKRILACVILVLAAPIIEATLQSGASRGAPFASTAFAGHTLGGGYCVCGCPGCICEPGEQIELCLPEARDAGRVAVTDTGTAAPSSQSNVPAAALFVGTGLLLWKRIRR